MTTPDTPISVPDAAQRLNVAPWRIAAAIEKGELKAVNISTGTRRRHWRISPTDLESWRASLPTNGAAK